jgi:hypothetical protein
MTRSFVLGNGQSRTIVPVDNLKTFGKTYGCNALYRDFTPDVLVATDRPISTQIQETGYAKKNKFYTRKPIEGLGALRLPQQYYGYSSGPNAVGLAAIDGARVVYMIGFDLGPTQQEKFNNVYAGTEFYKNVDSRPTYTGNWVRQIVKITADFSEIEFVRIVGPTTAVINDLLKIPNLQHEYMDSFLNRINNQKDF